MYLLTIRRSNKKKTLQKIHTAQVRIILIYCRHDETKNSYATKNITFVIVHNIFIAKKYFRPICKSGKDSFICR